MSGGARVPVAHPSAAVVRRRTPCGCVAAVHECHGSTTGTSSPSKWRVLRVAIVARRACAMPAPLATLLDYLEAGQPLSEFLEDFPTVTREQAVGADADESGPRRRAVAGSPMISG